MTELNKYFTTQLKQHHTQMLKTLHVDILKSTNKVARQVRFGYLDINQQPTNLVLAKEDQQPENQNWTKQTKSKRRIIQQLIQNLNRRDFQSDEAYKQAKQQIILQYQEDIKQQKQQKQKINRQTEQKVKKWTQQQKKLNQIKQMKLTQEQRIRQMQQEINKRMKEQQKVNSIEQRKKIIQQKMKVIQDRKLRRQFNLHNIKSQSQEQIPLYKEYEKRYKQIQDQRKFQQQIIKKNHKISMKIDHEGLKNHQRMFITKLQERNKKFEQSRARADSVPSAKFNQYFTKDQEKTKQQLEKKKRIWKYHQKLRDRPIQIDEAKKVQVQIQVDKAKNPLKYNFLAQKKLNDFQIYDAFKSFQLNKNHNQKGKQYFKELKQKISNGKLQKSSSMTLIRQSAVSERPQYKNYLQQLKAKRPQTQQQKDEIQKIMNKKNKDKAYKQLQKKSQILEMDAFQKMKQLKNMDSKNIRSLLKKQAQIDETYTKALKARLACLELST